MYPKPPGKPTGMKVSPKDAASAKVKFATLKENSPKKVSPKDETKPLPITRRAVGKVVGAVAGAKAEYKYLAKKADYVTAEGKFTKKKK